MCYRHLKGKTASLYHPYRNTKISVTGINRPITKYLFYVFPLIFKCNILKTYHKYLKISTNIQVVFTITQSRKLL